MRPAVALLPALLSLLLSCAPSGDPEATVEPVNAVAADTSFEVAFGRPPAADDEEWTRIATHLRFVENELRARDTSQLSDRERHARALNLQRLHDYWTAGLFPRNG